MDMACRELGLMRERVQQLTAEGAIVTASVSSAHARALQILSVRAQRGACSRGIESETRKSAELVVAYGDES